MEKKNKYRIYIDEVGNSDLNSSDNPNHRFLSLTGLIFELNYIRNIVVPEIDSFKQKFFPSHHPDEPIILHRKEIVNKKYPFNNLKNKELEENFNSELLRILNDLEYTIVSVVIDKKTYKEKYKEWKDDPYHYCLKILIERFYYFLKKTNAIGDVMVESRGGKEDKRLKDSFSKIYSYGTEFVRSKDIQCYLTSKELKVKPKNSNIAGLQLADLIAHPSRRFIFKYYNLIEIKKNIFGDQIIEIIKNKYYSGINNELDGYGIKVLP